MSTFGRIIDGAVQGNVSFPAVLLRIAACVIISLIPLAFALADEGTPSIAGRAVGVAKESPVSKSLKKENLVLFVKVWGFLKYHHPAATTGRVNWDGEFLGQLSSIRDAADKDAVRARLVAWIDTLGTPPPCTNCAALPQNVALAAPVDWIRDERELGAALSSRLQAIYANRLPGTQHYVALTPNVGNVVFKNEEASPGFPDLDHRLLAASRYWNSIEYWSPNRDVQGIEWQHALLESLDSFESARNEREYELAVLSLAARFRDGHANALYSFTLLPPVGDCDVPISLSWVQNKLVVATIEKRVAGIESLQRGDVIVAIDGTPVDKIIESRRPFYSYSTEQAFRRDVAYLMLRGTCTAVKFTTASAKYTVIRSSEPRRRMENDMEGPSFRLLEPNIFYLKLTSIRVEDLARYIATARTAKGLIVDLRGYPSAFVVYALGQQFVASDTPFALFTVGDLSNPGAFKWVGPAVLHSNSSASMSEGGQFGSNVDVLIDATTQSQAEFTAMALRAAPNVKLVGSATAGTDGDVSTLTLPGGLSTSFSGLGVFFPDGRATQRIGLKPDIEVEQTVDGIKRGSDEVLQGAIDDLRRRASMYSAGLLVQ